MDAGEQLSVTLKREFGEEALNSLEVADNKRDNIKKCVDHLFENGTEVSSLLIRYIIFLLTCEITTTY